MATTTQRGYGYQHQQARRAAIAALTDGTPCPRCGQPMYRAMSRYLDLDHGIPVALGGRTGPTHLAHRRCNRRHGALLRAAIHGQRIRARRW